MSYPFQLAIKLDLTNRYLFNVTKTVLNKIKYRSHFFWFYKRIKLHHKINVTVLKNIRYLFRPCVCKRIIFTVINYYSRIGWKCFHRVFPRKNLTDTTTFCVQQDMIVCRYSFVYCFCGYVFHQAKRKWCQMIFRSWKLSIAMSNYRFTLN